MAVSVRIRSPKILWKVLRHDILFSKYLMIANPHTRKPFIGSKTRVTLCEEQTLQTLKLREATRIPLPYALLNSLWKPDRRVYIVTLRVRKVLNVAGRGTDVKMDLSH